MLELLDEPGDPATRLLGTVRTLNTTFEEQLAERLPGLLEVFVHAARDPDPGNPVTATWTDLGARLAAVITELHAGGVSAGLGGTRQAMAALILAVAARAPSSA